MKRRQERDKPPASLVNNPLFQAINQGKNLKSRSTSHSHPHPRRGKVGAEGGVGERHKFKQSIDDRERKRRQVREQQRRENDRRRLAIQGDTDLVEHTEERSHYSSQRRTTSENKKAALLLPPILVIRNLATGTTVEDVETILREFGEVKDCRAVTVQFDNNKQAVMVEAMFKDRSHTFRAKSQLDGSLADDQVLKCEIARVHEIIDEPHEDEKPRYVTNWDGPPLYSDAIDYNHGISNKHMDNQAVRK